MKTMRFLALFTAITLFTAGTVCQAQEPGILNQKETWLDGFAPKTFSATTNFRSDDTFTTGHVVYPEPVIQQDLFVGFKNGLSIDMFGTMPAGNSEDFGKNFSTEVDLTIGWSVKIGDFDTSLSIAY
jgi:hypothetical protein